MIVRLIFPLAFLCLLVVGVAHAHTVTEIGDYAIIAAWENEPPVVGERNSIVVDIFNADGEISATDVTLRQFELVNGETTRSAVPGQSFAETVRYRVSFIPTVEGEIGVRLVGTLAGEPLDVIVYPERVESANIIQFPDVTLSDAALQDGLIRIEDRMSGLERQIIIAYVIAAGGIVAGIGAVISARRKQL
jgi:hypothetical protein